MLPTSRPTARPDDRGCGAALSPLHAATGREPFFGPAPLRRAVPRWRRWVFELSVPADEFLRALQRGLVLRGVQVEPAVHFDFQARAFGARAFVKVGWADEGLQVDAKVKGGLFSSPKALETLLLEAGREAHARLASSGTV